MIRSKTFAEVLVVPKYNKHLEIEMGMDNEVFVKFTGQNDENKCRLSRNRTYTVSPGAIYEFRERQYDSVRSITKKLERIQVAPNSDSIELKENGRIFFFLKAKSVHAIELQFLGDDPLYKIYMLDGRILYLPGHESHSTTISQMFSIGVTTFGEYIVLNMLNEI
jgi:hypothetical protein